MKCVKGTRGSLCMSAVNTAYGAIAGPEESSESAGAGHCVVTKGIVSSS